MLPMHFDLSYFVYLAPAFLLAMWGQIRHVHSAYAQAQQQPAPLSGAAAARHVLDSAGLSDIKSAEIPGKLTDHYDPRQKVLRLSPEVYQSRSLAAVGIAAHEEADTHSRRPALRAAGDSQRRRAGCELRQRIQHGAVRDRLLGSSAISGHGGRRTVCGRGLLSGREPASGVRRQHREGLVSLGIADHDQMVYVNRVSPRPGPMWPPRCNRC